METISMSRRERHRLEVFSRVRRGEITLVKASALLELSYRQAKRFLQKKFLATFNRRFVKQAARSGDLHRRVPRGLDMGRVLSIRETRVVQNDWTLRFENRWFQLAERRQKLALAGRSVTVCRRLDGGLELLYGGREPNCRELCAPPQARQEEIAPDIRSNQGQRPSADHPWRRRPHPEWFQTSHQGDISICEKEGHSSPYFSPHRGFAAADGAAGGWTGSVGPREGKSAPDGRLRLPRVGTAGRFAAAGAVAAQTFSASITGKHGDSTSDNRYPEAGNGNDQRRKFS